MKEENIGQSKLEHRLTDFDPHFSPYHEINREAAEQRGLRYDPYREVYVDEDGFLIRDKFGQPF